MVQIQVFHSVSIHRIVRFILGLRILVEGSITYNREDKLKEQATGHSLQFIGLAVERTRSNDEERHAVALMKLFDWFRMLVESVAL